MWAAAPLGRHGLSDQTELILAAGRVDSAGRTDRTPCYLTGGARGAGRVAAHRGVLLEISVYGRVYKCLCVCVLLCVRVLCVLLEIGVYFVV